jgi:hypothetical protein
MIYIGEFKMLPPLTLDSRLEKSKILKLISFLKVDLHMSTKHAMEYPNFNECWK